MRIMIAAALAALTFGFAGLATGQDDPIKARRALMKTNGASAKAAFDMATGKTPYDAAAAAKAMKTIEDDMAAFVTLFPEGSDKGDTNALPAVWENMAGFKAAADKLVTDAKAAEAAAAQGADAFKTALGAVGGDCQACHEEFRKPQ